MQEDGGILRGHAVRGEAVVLPGRRVGIIRQHPQGIQGGGDGDGDLMRQKQDIRSEQKRASSARAGRGWGDAQELPKSAQLLQNHDQNPPEVCFGCVIISASGFSSSPENFSFLLMEEQQQTPGLCDPLFLGILV